MMENTAYFDNAATTFPKPEQVYEFTDKFYRECGVNVGRGQYRLASKAASLVQDTKSKLLDLFHCPNKKVVFTHTATEAINLVIKGLNIYDNCNIYISPFEHNAVTRVLHSLQEEYKINIIELAVDKSSMTFNLPKIKNQFSDKRPNIMIVSHASNVCGVVAPIYELTSISKEFDCINLIDMSQTAGLIDTDLSGNEIDFAVFAGHKTLYSPLGVAGIISDFKNELKPLIYGGTGVDSASQSLPKTIPEKYEVASQNIMAIAGLFSSLDWINEIGINNIFAKEQENYLRLVKILNNYSNINIIECGQADCIGVVSCVFDDYSSDNIGQILSDHNVAVRTGLHCAPTAHKFLDTFPSGTVRFSVSYFNNDKDFNVLIQALDYILENS